MIKHGGAKTNAYRSWADMRVRCRIKSKDFRLYGARGITVCPEWNSFVVFFADMGDRPQGKTLERINNDWGYYPENCCWATPAEQSLNRRTGWPRQNADPDAVYICKNGHDKRVTGTHGANKACAQCQRNATARFRARYHGRKAVPATSGRSA